MVAVTIVQTRAANPAASIQTLNKKASPNSIRQSKGQRHAIVVLPPAAAVQEILSTEAAWIARGRIDYSADRGETLACILGELGERPPQDGLAALRLWGQTGQRPTQWMSCIMSKPVKLSLWIS